MGSALRKRCSVGYADREPVDLLATVVAFTAHAIADSLRDFRPTSCLCLAAGRITAR